LPGLKVHCLFLSVVGAGANADADAFSNGGFASADADAAAFTKGGVASAAADQSINVTPVAMKLKKLMPAIH
jgi:hypothetical protein